MCIHTLHINISFFCLQLKNYICFFTTIIFYYYSVLFILYQLYYYLYVFLLYINYYIIFIEDNINHVLIEIHIACGYALFIIFEFVQCHLSVSIFLSITIGYRVNASLEFSCIHTFIFIILLSEYKNG